MRKGHLLFFVCFIAFAIGAQELKSNWQFMTINSKAPIIFPHSIDPDNGQLKLSQTGNKWRNMLGNTTNLVSFENRNWKAQLQSNFFVEIHDFEKGQWMSYDIWRGQMEGTVFVNSTKFDKLSKNKVKTIVGIGYGHESQHVTNYDGYLARYCPYYNHWFRFYYFPAADLRTWEFFRFQALFSTKVKGVDIWLRPSTKLYPKPILNTGNNIINKSSWACEAGIKRDFKKKGTLSLNYFYERIENNYDPVKMHFLGKWKAGPFVYNYMELGWLSNTAVRFNPFVGYSISNGRGMDFAEKFNEFYYGFRFCY